MIAMIGTSDRLCWLAETCKILLLLLLHSAPRETNISCMYLAHELNMLLIINNRKASKCCLHTCIQPFTLSVYKLLHSLTRNLSIADVHTSILHSIDKVHFQITEQSWL